MSKTKALSGNCSAKASIPCLRRRRVVSWKGRNSSEVALYARASASRMALSARTCLRVPSMSSGNMCDWSSRLREKMVTSFPSLWICARKPSYLYCATTAPIFAMMASVEGSRSASWEWTGLPSCTSSAATARCASSSSGCSKTRPGDEPQVRGLVVGPLQQLALLGVVPPGLRQCIEHGGVSDAQPQVPQQDAHHVFGRHAVYAREQV